MSDIERLCWANAESKKREEVRDVVERVQADLREKARKKARLVARRVRMLWMMKRLAWGFLGASAAMIGVCIGLGKGHHALFWVMVVIGAVVLTAVTEDVG